MVFGNNFQSTPTVDYPCMKKRDGQRKLHQPPGTKLSTSDCAAAIPLYKVASGMHKSAGFAVLDQADLQRLKQSKFISKEERREEHERKEQDIKDKTAESERLRRYFKEMDDERMIRETENQNIDADSDEEKGKQEKTIEKAFLAKQEQEEAVKRCNKLIRNIKYSAAWEHQIEERKRAEKAEADYESRMQREAIDRLKMSLEADDKLEEKRREMRRQYARDIQQQLRDRKTIRFREAERVDVESQQMRQATDAFKRDEEYRLMKIKKGRINYRNELNKVVEISNTYKRMLCEQDQEDDRRIVDYIQSKEKARENAKKVKEVAKAELKRQQDMLYEVQQKMLDSRGKSEEMRYMTEREQIDRKYRRKELEEVQKKKKFEEEIKRMRVMQMNKMREMKAIHIANEAEEMRELSEVLKKEKEREAEQKQSKAVKKFCYRQDVIAQMNHKERMRRREEDEKRAERLAYLEAERLRNDNISTVIKRKLTALRQQSCLPERHLQELERRIYHGDRERLAK